MDISKRYGQVVEDDETGYYAAHYRDINGQIYKFAVVKVGDLRVVMSNRVVLEPTHTVVHSVETSSRPS